MLMYAGFTLKYSQHKHKHKYAYVYVNDYVNEHSPKSVWCPELYRVTLCTSSIAVRYNQLGQDVTSDDTSPFWR